MKEHFKRFKGFYIFCIGLIFNLCESLYYGSDTVIGFNMLPHSTGEYVCDIISLIIVFLGFSMVMLDSKTTINHYSFNVDYKSGQFPKEMIDSLKEKENELKANKKEGKVKKNNES